MALLPGNALPLLRSDLDEPRQVLRPDLPAQIVVIGTLQDDSASRLARGQAMQRATHCDQTGPGRVVYGDIA